MPNTLDAYTDAVRFAELYASAYEGARDTLLMSSVPHEDRFQAARDIAFEVSCSLMTEEQEMQGEED